MNALLRKQDIQDVATTLSTDPVFLEKDFHVSRIVDALARISHDKFSLVFSGGTSLLQAYQIINRFSEDADFRIIYPVGTTCSRGERRAFRKTIHNTIKEIPDIQLLMDTLICRDSSRFFSIMLHYRNRFGRHASLRPEIKLDCTFTDRYLPDIEIRETSCVLGRYLPLPKPRIRCLSLAETTADKLSALIWRTLGRNRNDRLNDITMIRHLHDLSPLLTMTPEQTDIVQQHLLKTYEIDFKRGGQIASNLSKAANAAIHALKSDPNYQREYENFVTNMCFGNPEQHISFVRALEIFEKFVFSI